MSIQNLLHSLVFGTILVLQIILLELVDAFNAVNNISVNNSTAPIAFNAITMTKSSSFNQTQMSVSASDSVESYRIYWMIIGADVPAFSQFFVILKNANFSIVTNQTQVNVTQTLSRSGAIKVQPNSPLALFSIFSLSSAYWSGFRLDDVLCPLVAFHVARTTPYAMIGQITYDTIFVNEGQGWQAFSNAFVTPLAGIYVFSFSGGVLAGKQYWIDLVVNSVTVRRATGGLGVFISTGIDMTSKTTLLGLQSGDKVTIVNNKDQPLYSDSINLQIAFNGFCYSPINKQESNYYVST